MKRLAPLNGTNVAAREPMVRASFRLAVLFGFVAQAAWAQAAPVTLRSQGPTADTVPVAATARRVAFTLTNSGADSATYYVACAGLGAAACVTGWADPVRLASGQHVTLMVDYRATRAGRGLVVVRVRDPRSGARASAAFVLTVTGS